MDNKKDFNLDEVLLNSIYYHNKNVHISTNCKPVKIKYIDNIEIIQSVNDNIKKYIKNYKI